ncbi:esterase [Mycobacteroides franklinii]|uniref:Esterase n=1 Tax=Mycobacteroides franklinii TaxID=948102 RepID=A0A1S1LE14_9MYCO|nr:serine hydrolase domain-containing protein [Mycobacteroides franklinii]OHU31201.1 esterase [Mycobacteroides franklinii]
MSTSLDVAVNGTSSPDFDNVRRAFALNFLENDELGAAVAIWVDGELVVNLWAGWADEARTRPWTEDTLAPVYSGTKGLMSTCVHMLIERGVLDLHAPVARYWPEFGQAGKESITLAMVLGHRSGVIGPRTRLTPEQAANWDEVCEHISRATPWWEPGTAQGYHMATFGFILGEVVRRTTGKTLGQFLRTEVAEPYGLDVHVGLPHSEHHRCAELVNKPYLRDVFRGAPGEFDCMSDHPLAGPLISGDFIPDDEIARRDIALWRALEFPGTNAHVSALGMATFYNAMALGKLLSHDHMDVVRVSQGGFDPDVVLGPRVANHGWGLGYMLNQRCYAGPNQKTFGHGGSGGSYAFVDLEHRIGYSYVMNQFDVTKADADPRSVRLINELYTTLGVSPAGESL